MAQTATIHRDEKKHPKPYDPRDFNPYLRRPKPKPRVLTEADFKAIFGD